MATKKEAFQAEHDRVVMASVAKDGTLDQNDPEFIGGEFSVEATKRQAEVRAASIVDQQHAGTPAEEPLAGSNEATGETAKLKEEQEKAAKAASEAAESLVKGNQPEDSDTK